MYQVALLDRVENGGGGGGREGEKMAMDSWLRDALDGMGFLASLDVFHGDGWREEESNIFRLVRRLVWACRHQRDTSLAQLGELVAIADSF